MASDPYLYPADYVVLRTLCGSERPLRISPPATQIVVPVDETPIVRSAETFFRRARTGKRYFTWCGDRTRDGARIYIESATEWDRLP